MWRSLWRVLLLWGVRRSLGGWFPELEMTALQDLFNSTGGDSWRWKEEVYGLRWNFSVSALTGEYLHNPCGDEEGRVWQGITCSNTSAICVNDTCHVVALELESYYLRGVLSSTLYGLNHLTYLDFNTNLLYGTIPSSYGNLSALTYLDIGNNYLSGNIPSSLQNLSDIQKIFLHLNYLVGHIPPGLGSLEKLRTLYLYTNLLSGPIPSEFGGLVRVERLYLHLNRLTGAIPPELGLMSEVAYLLLYGNMITGVVPPEFGKLVKMRFLFMNENMLSGSIPHEIGALVNMNQFLVYDNMMTGSLPVQMSSMVQLTVIYAYFNLLTGSLPPEFGSLVHLQNLFLLQNFHTGSIPSEFGSLTDLQFIYMDFNFLTGSIPPEIGACTDMGLMYLNSNLLTGTIPPSLGNWEKMTNIYLDQNMLSGSIPSELGKLVLMEDFYLYDNMLTGSIPSEIGNLVDVEFFYFDRNMLSGTIPVGFGEFSRVRFFNLCENMLSGAVPSTFGGLAAAEDLILYDNVLQQTLPAQLSQCSSLRLLRLQGNLMTGLVEGIFSANSSMENIDISDNRFSGTIPPTLFDPPELRSVALSLNCFEGSLPSSMCGARNATVFSMDGLAAAKDCLNAKEISLTGVTLFNTMEGGVPSCLWSLNQLRVLHLTGNGLTGSIGDISQLGSSLDFLSLAHNKISGSIPDALQERGFYNMDLSYNKLTGKYTHAESSGNGSEALYLKVNRLSGRFPTTSEDSQFGKLGSLSGNLFGCGNIPDEDEDSEDYSCGSEELDYSLYIFVSFVLTLVVLATLLRLMVSRGYFQDCPLLLHLCEVLNNHRMYSRYMMSMCDAFSSIDSKSETELPNFSPLSVIKNFSDEIRTFTRMFGLLVLWHFATCIPLYVLKVLDFGLTHPSYTTHSYQYRWTFTSAYMHGELALGMLLLMWVGVVVGLSALTFQNNPFLMWRSETIPLAVNEKDSTSLVEISEHRDSELRRCVSKLKILPILFINGCVVGTVCGVYIYLSSQSYSSSTLVILQVLMAIFNLLWNIAFVPLLSHPMNGVKNVVWAEMWLLMFNNIFLPSIVTAMTSPACFQGLLITPDEVTSSYEYEYCAYRVVNADGSATCTNVATMEVEVAPLIPPFTYNNLCSSVLLTSFVPVFIFVCSFQILLCIMQFVVFTSSNYEKYPESFRQVLFGVFWPSHWSNSDNTKDTVDSSCADTAEPLLLLKSNRIIAADILNPLLVFCTFGICSPFLALIMMISVCFRHYIWLIVIGRFVKYRVTGIVDNNESNANCVGPHSISNRVISETNKDNAVIALGAACLPVLNILSRCVWPVIWSSALFFAFLCWDVLGDDIGWKRAAWVPGAVLAVPVVLWVAQNVIIRQYSAVSRSESRSLSSLSQSNASVSDEEQHDITTSNPLQNSLMMKNMSEA